MAFASNIVIGSAAFLLGMVFVSQVVDIPLLYQPLTEEAIQNGYAFYKMWYEAPGAVKALLHVAVLTPLVVLLIKLHKWSESAKFFDGTGIGLQVAVMVLYLTVHIPSLRTFLPEVSQAEGWTFLPPPPPRESPATEDEKIEALRVLSAGNTLVGLLLVGVIAMQVGQAWASSVEAREQRRIDDAARAAASEQAKTKKDN